MASEFLQKQRGEFSSFWDREVAGPARETYLKLLAWKDQAIGYLGLRKETMALRPGTVEHQPVVKSSGISRRDFLRLAGTLGAAYSFAEALHVASWFLKYGTTAGVGPIPFVGGNPDLARAVNPAANTPTSEVSPSPTATATPTGTPTQTPTETATASSTEASTARPTATEYVLDMEHGELFEPVKCQGEWERCDQIINEKLKPYLATVDFPGASSSRETTTGRATIVMNPDYLGYFMLNFQGLDPLNFQELNQPDYKIEIDGYVFVFGAKVKGKNILLPLMPIGSGFGDAGVYNITDPESLSHPNNLSGWWKSPRELILILDSAQDEDLLQIYTPHDIAQSPIDNSPKGKFVASSAADPYGKEDGIASVGLVESFFIRSVQWP